jgi:glycosidase
MKFNLNYISFLVSLFCLNLLSFKIHAQDLRIEPPNWWHGMNHTDLQLLVHGDGIGKANAELVDPTSIGVELKSIDQADSPNYLFLNLDLSKLKKSGTIELVFNFPGKEPATRINYQFDQRKQEPLSLTGFNTSDVIYLITPDRFSNGKPDNDVVSGMRESYVGTGEDDRHGGDIQGILDHLDYLMDLGVTTIWPSPLLENNMPKYSYHGYAITDYYKVDARFGDNSSYRLLADELRKRDMKLVFDGVVNHCGKEHWWMKDLPFKDWINNKGKFAGTNHRRTIHQDPYASDRDSKMMLEGWFVEDMPDLNQRNPYMAQYLIQNSIWWIEFLGLSGIRQDTYPYAFAEFLSEWACRIMKEYPNFKIVGEEWSYNPVVVSYWQKGKTDGLGSCLSSVMDFPMQEKIVTAIKEEESWDKGLIKIYEGLANDIVYNDPSNLLIFLDNHDMDRIYTQFDKSTKKLKMALTYLATMRGIPQMYYGTEVLADNTIKRGSHGMIRSNFPGGFPDDVSSAKDQKGLSEEQFEMLEFTRDLFNWRKDNSVIHTGKLMHFAPRDSVYVYFRYTETQKIMVVINKGKEKALELAPYAEMINAHRQMRKVFGGDWEIASSSIIVPEGASIFEFK